MSTDRRSPVRLLAARSFAKINLGLKLIGPRADGFHELRTVFQTIDLCDRLVFTPRRDRRVVLESSDARLPRGEENLVTRAARHLFSKAHVRAGVTISLEKHIPVGAGLGGGSSNAAVTLLALNRLFRFKLSPEDLLAVAADLGSDVPFFLTGGRALGLGRGEEIIPLPDATPATLLLAVPALSISTREAYQKASLWLTKGRRANNMARFPLVVFEKESALELFENDFESVLFHEYPVLRRLKRKLLAVGARQAQMTGSGSAVFGFFSSGSRAQQAETKLQSYHSTSTLSTFVVHSIPRSQYLKKVFAASR